MLTSAVENSQTESGIKSETLRILAEAESIQNRSQNEDIQKEYEQVRLATIGALKNLRIETHSDLETIRAELGNSIDPYTYQEGQISQEELKHITREFSDLQQVQNQQVSPSNNEDNLSIFGSTMLGYIKTTNEAILDGGEDEIASELNWYHTAFGGSGEKLSMFEYTSASTAYTGALAILGSERLDFYRGQVEGIQNSGETLETKLFQLSELLYQVGKECSAPSELEVAHNLATREIIQKVIENQEGSFAVGFDSEKGYFMTKNIHSESSELEIGTYLCSLNKGNKLTRENLVQPNGPFSKIQLFAILEKYKNGAFGNENIRGLFPEYLEGFDENMEQIISETINASQNPREISGIVQSGLNTGHINTVLGYCELCSKIENYTLADIQAITPEEMEVYKNNPKTAEFYTGLQKKIEFHEKTMGDIETTLRDLLLESLGQDTIPSGLEEKLQSTTLETYDFMETYFQNTAGSICKVELMQLLQSEQSPLQDLLAYVAEQQSIIIDLGVLDRSITDLTNIGIDGEIGNLETQEQALQGEIEKISQIPEGERSKVQESILQSLLAQLSDTQREKKSSQQAREREVEASEIRGLNQEQINELKSYMTENNLSWSSAIDLIQGREYDFSDDTLVDFFLKHREHIRSIRRKDDIIEFLVAIDGKSQNNDRIELSEIYPSLRGEIEVLQKVKNLKVNDINLIPESFFEIQSTQDAQEKLQLLLKNSFGCLRLILTKFDIHTSSENKVFLVEVLASLLSQRDTHQYNYALSQIPEYIPDAILGADIDGLLPKKTKSSESNDYDMFQSTYMRIMNGAQETTQDDKDFIHRYFSKYGVLENNGQFKNLLVQGKIEAKTLQEIVPNMGDFDIFKDIIESGIQKYKVSFAELLPHSLHSNPEIIEWTLQSCFTQYEDVDIGFQNPLRQSQQTNLLKASNILQINNAPGLYAAYTGLGENSELLRKLFWNKFENKQLESIVENAGEVYTSKFSRDKVDIIIHLVKEISRKQEEENAHISQLGKIQEAIKLGIDRKSLVFARAYLDRSFPNPEFQNKINEIIENMQGSSFNPELIFPLIADLIKESGIENQEGFKLETFLDEFLKEVQEGAQIEQTQFAEIDFTKQEVGNFPTVLLQTGDNQNEESFEIGEVPSSERERNHKILRDYIQYLKISGRENNQESIVAYIEKYGIEIESRFGQALETFIEAEETIVTTYLLRQKDTLKGVTQRTEEHTSGNPSSFKGLNEEIEDQKASGNIDYSGIGSTRDILKARGLEMNINGEIIEIKDIPQAPLLPQNISSIDLRDTYRELSYELNLTPAESQSLTEKELKMIAGNEKVKENFISFRQTLVDLNMEDIWQFRNDIFKAIGSLDFNTRDGNYIGPNELNIFLSKVTYASLGKEKVPELKTTPANIQETYRIIREKNQIGVLGTKDIRSVGTGGGIIETAFREKFAPKDAGVVAFKLGSFLEALKSIKKSQAIA